MERERGGKKSLLREAPQIHAEGPEKRKMLAVPMCLLSCTHKLVGVERMKGNRNHVGISVGCTQLLDACGTGIQVENVQDGATRRVLGEKRQI